MTSQLASAVLGGRRTRHAPFVLAVVAGIVIRVVVGLAYRPAILFYDSNGYLTVAAHPALGTLRPIGYSLLLWPLRTLVPGSLEPIVVVQHALGLLVAVACYAFLVRRGLPPWGATLATLPLLLDPLQLVLEHYVLSDVAFEAMLVAACLLLLWKERPTVVLLVGAGLTAGSCALVRGAGTFLLVAFLVAVVCLRVGWVRVVVFGVAAILPIAVYATAYHSKYGVYALSQSGSRFLYARLAPLVRCDDPQLHLPPYEKMLCPRHPVGSRPSSDYYMWGHHKGPAYHVVPPPGMTTEQVLGDFSKRVVRAQPAAFAEAVLADFGRGFLPSRTYDVPGFPSRYWLFRDHYWMLETRDWQPRAAPGPAGFLQTYREVLWTPGPLNALLLLASAAAAIGVGRARRCGDRVAIALIAGSGTLTLVTTAAVSGFSWRYQLPQLALFPVAGALAVAALARGPAPGRPAAPAPLRLLDRAAGLVAARSPVLRRAHERGWLAALLALVVGAVVAFLVAVGAVGSGWFRRVPGGVAGLASGLVVMVWLVVTQRRGAAGDVAATAGSEPAPTPPA
jgi:hypothetical protein